MYKKLLNSSLVSGLSIDVQQCHKVIRSDTKNLGNTKHITVHMSSEMQIACYVTSDSGRHVFYIKESIHQSKHEVLKHKIYQYILLNPHDYLTNIKIKKMVGEIKSAK